MVFISNQDLNRSDRKNRRQPGRIESRIVAVDRIVKPLKTMLINTSKPSRIKAPNSTNGHHLHASAASPVALGALYAKIEALEERLRRIEGVSQPLSNEKNGKKHPAKNGKNGHDARHMAVVVISSVVATLIDQPHRIVSVSPLNNQSSHSACPWALQGRMLLHEARS